MLLSSLVLVAFFSGCDDDDDSKLYFSGSIRLTVDSYVEAGYTKTFCVDTLITDIARDEDDDEGGIGFYYTLPGSTVRDTIKTENGSFTQKTFTVEAPDSLDTFNFTLGAFADGYYETAGTVSFTVVRPGINGKSTLTGYDLKEGTPSFTDDRDGSTYYYNEAGGLYWMGRNLVWGGVGMNYDNCSCPGVGSVFGRYYTWEEAQTACPDGWRLPSDAEWAALGLDYANDSYEGVDIPELAGHLMENIYFNGTRMWEYWPKVKIDNASSLCAAPFGYAVLDDNSSSFSGLDKYAVFWTSSEEDGLGVYRYIYTEKNYLYYGLADKRYFAASVRCVKDIPDGEE